MMNPEHQAIPAAAAAVAEAAPSIMEEAKAVLAELPPSVSFDLPAGPAPVRSASRKPGRSRSVKKKPTPAAKAASEVAQQFAEMFPEQEAAT